MNEDEIILQTTDDDAIDKSDATQETQASPVLDDQQLENNELPQDKIGEMLDALGVTPSIAATARAIIEPLQNGGTPSRSVVQLIVQAINHDEDVKNAEAAGYLRGRNEKIEAATAACNDKEPQPVNFPVYRRRSFWDI